MRAGTWARRIWLGLSLGSFGILALASWRAPDGLSKPSFANAYLWPSAHLPFGTDDRGIPLLDYALQGAHIVAWPAVVSGLVVALMAALAGLARCADLQWVDTALQAFTEVMGALPRLVVVLVVALALPRGWQGLLPIGVTWAVLAAPAAMDEAASTAGRMGGARFVEALRAHGFSAFRIYLYHITWLNLRSVLVRQAAEVAMQVVFLEIALSYLVQASSTANLTHKDNEFSWASLLYFGFQTIVTKDPSDWLSDGSLMHALFLGVALVGLVALAAQSLRLAARER